MKTLSYEISAHVKGTTLPILVRVLASINYWKVWFLTLCSSLHTRNKQQKFAQGKLSCKPRPFVCWYPVTLIVGLFVCMLRCLFCYVTSVHTHQQIRKMNVAYTFTFLTNIFVFLRIPLILNETIPPKQVHCHLASSCCGWEDRPVEKPVEYQ